MKKLITIEELKEKIPDFITSLSEADLRASYYQYDAIISQKSLTDQVVCPFATRLDLEIMIILLCDKFSLNSLVDPYDVVPAGAYCDTRVVKLNVEFVDGKASYLNIELASYLDQVDTPACNSSLDPRFITQMLPTEQPPAPNPYLARRRFVADNIAVDDTETLDDRRFRRW